MKLQGMSVARFAVSAALALSMSVGGVPSVVFAESLELAVEPQAQPATEEAALTGASDAAPEAQTAGDVENSDASAGGTDAPQSTEADAQGSSEETGGEATTSDATTEGADATSANASESGDGDSAETTGTEATVAESAETITGTWGTCAWEIDAAGTLTVHPGTGAERSAEGWPWSAESGKVKAIRFVEEDGNKVVPPAGIAGTEDTASLFSGLNALESADLSGLDLSGVTDLSYLFNGCASLKSVTMAGCDTSNVTSMASMFHGCTALEEFDATALNTKSVENFNGMFKNCGGLKTLDVAGWDVSNGTDFSSMFEGCAGVGAFNVSQWNVSRGKLFTRMFYGCSSITELDVTGWNTTNAENTDSIIMGCSALKQLSRGENTKSFDMFGGAKAEPVVEPGTIAPIAGINGWYSQNEQKWFTSNEINKNRTNIADIYTKTEDPVEKPEERKVETSIDIKEGAINVTSNNLGEIAYGLLSSSEQGRFDAGENAKVWLEVAPYTTETAGYASVQEALKGFSYVAGAGSSPTYDVTLWKQVGDDTPRMIEDTGETGVQLTFEVPDEQRNKDENLVRTYRLYRLHLGSNIKDYAFGPLAETTDPNIACTNSKFSYFFYTYEDKTADGGSKSNSSGSGVTSTRTTTPSTSTTRSATATPKTGDPTIVGLAASLVAAGAAAVGMGVRRRRK